MNNYKLLIYDYEFLPQIKSELKNYDFLSFSSINQKCTKLENINTLQLGKHAIDITNYFYDLNSTTSSSYRTYFELYIYYLIEYFPDVKILLSNKELNSFFELFPYLFNHSDIIYYIDKKNNPDSKIKNTISYLKKQIYIYEKTSDLKEEIDNNLIYSFTNLIKSFNGINVAFDFEKLINKPIYIDLTSLIQYLSIKTEQIFYYEIILNNLFKNDNFKYTINKLYLEKCNEIFPFLFINHKNIPWKISENPLRKNLEKQSTNNYLDNIEEIINKLNNNLYGHNQFKDDFKKNLIKYKYLNTLGRKKILSIFICGKSGIGKTELARQLHNIIFQNENPIKLNFGNYSTRDVLNSLIGAPKGYIGSEDGGELTNKIKNSKSKIILIDEFEKADDKVFNFFYELLEDGKYTDRLGVEHDLNQYIIIFTSNLTRENYTKMPEPLRSRFDMKYIFDELTYQDKQNFIEKYTHILIKDFKNILDIEILEEQLSLKDNPEILKFDNIREMTRKIDDIIIDMAIKRNNIKNF